MGPKEKLIDNLSDAYAFYLEGHSFSDVGAKFGVSHSTVRRTFLRHGFITTILLAYSMSVPIILFHCTSCSKMKLIHMGLIL